MLSVQQTARLLGLSDRAVYNYCKDGTIACVRIGSRVLIRRAEIERLTGEPLDEHALETPARNRRAS